MTQDKNDPRSAPSEAPGGEEAERKERVLHTRVPESLDDAIRAAASELGVSVSNLVRNVLANALEVVEAATLTVPRKAAQAAATVRGGPGAAPAAGHPVPRGSSEGGGTAPAPATGPATPAPEPEIEPRVLGWQEAILNLNAICDACNAILPRGTRAAIAVPERGAAARAVRCLPCLEELTRDAAR